MTFGYVRVFGIDCCRVVGVHVQCRSACVYSCAARVDVDLCMAIHHGSCQSMMATVRRCSDHALLQKCVSCFGSCGRVLAALVLVRNQGPTMYDVDL
jgi:hypothetical protein